MNELYEKCCQIKPERRYEFSDIRKFLQEKKNMFITEATTENQICSDEILAKRLQEEFMKMEKEKLLMVLLKLTVQKEGFQRTTRAG